MPRHRTIGRIPHGDDPLAYLLTWTTYGTWLPGDDRGWIEKQADLRQPDSEQRQIVESVIRRHCEIRQWHLHAVNCRTNHVHAIVTGDRYPHDIMDQPKAWCTRRLKEHPKEKSSSEHARQKWSTLAYHIFSR